MVKRCALPFLSVPSRIVTIAKRSGRRAKRSKEIESDSSMTSRLLLPLETRAAPSSKHDKGGFSGARNLTELISKAVEKEAEAGEQWNGCK